MGSTVFPPAASGPTLSEITTAGTSAGWGATGGTWTLLGRITTASTGPIFSGLSGYKKYKIICNAYYSSDSANYFVNMILNGDSAGNKYSWNHSGIIGASHIFSIGDQKNVMVLGEYISSSGYNWGNRFEILIDGAESGAGKTITGIHRGYGGGQNWSYDLKGSYNSTSAISSIKFVCNNTSSATEALNINLNGPGSFMELWGGN